ncbi:unnamed protein product, partial [Mesorhabditis belari]|uniref:Uncharacterized protein n=1 Tax=Mesorhabditis belari TaxID=2138241 RepID=A0AAF3J1G2_9BILA
MAIQGVLLFVFLFHFSTAYLKWADYCEAIKMDDHSTFLPERLESKGNFETKGGDEEINEFFEDPNPSLTETVALLEVIESQLTASEKARRCDTRSLRAPFFNPDFPVAPTCAQICARCFPGSIALCVQRRPKLDLMRTCLCTYNSQSPISGAVFSFRHDKRVEQLLRG